ncbi:ABC transporter permease [Jiangella aurantiaca]|uniref:Autoinducer 2 import system permease protein LsrD n=1 Tax=Jiangella aurantiaca TaxID=2530373 RepID=A0A4R5AFA8_9ACTN|nr:ABC transporter permease [Jiangella aurantiaca]TDD71253.1 ABC transporter permease [Jiangella aurantiaca]
MTTAGLPARRHRLDPHLAVSYALAAVCLVLLGTTTSRGFDPDRILGLLGNQAALGIVALGQTLVLLVRGLDLSVGSVISLSTVVTAAVMDGNPDRIAVAVAATVALGAVVGLANGLLVAYAGIAPLLVTLAVGTIVQGATYVYTNGQPRGGIAGGFRGLADDRIAGTPLPWSLLLWLGVWGIVALTLYRTVAGRRYYAVGANPRAAWLSGVPTTRHSVVAYIASGVLASVAGLHLAAYTGSPSLTVGTSYTLMSIAAAVIGGVALTGGGGGPTGTFAGVLVLVFLGTVLETMDVPAAVQLIVQGGVVIVMMLVNRRLDPARRSRA